jgi:hypothetical protein
MKPRRAGEPLLQRMARILLEAKENSRLAVR